MEKRIFPFRGILVLLLGLFLSVTVSAQGFTVKGIVKDAKLNDPIIGATILEKGTSNGTVTDMDGNYSLNVASKDATVVISYIG